MGTHNRGKGWYSAYNLMFYLDDNVRVIKAIYFDDETGITTELKPYSIYKHCGYLLSENAHTIGTYMRKNGASNKHILASLILKQKFNPDTMKLEPFF